MSGSSSKPCAVPALLARSPSRWAAGRQGRCRANRGPPHRGHWLLRVTGYAGISAPARPWPLWTYVGPARRGSSQPRCPRVSLPSAQRWAKWHRRMPPWPAPHAHTPLAFQLANARLGNPHATAPEVSYKDLRQSNFYWDVLLEEVASGQITSLSLFPCRQQAPKESESSGAGCSRP